MFSVCFLPLLPLVIKKNRSAIELYTRDGRKNRWKNYVPTLEIHDERAGEKQESLAKSFGKVYERERETLLKIYGEPMGDP